MIDIERLHKLEKEADQIKDNIIKQSWLVHHIIGRDARSNCGDVLIDIERYTELIEEISDMQVAIKDRLNNIIKKHCETNPQKTLIEVDAIDDIDISTCGLVYFNCTVTPKYDIRLSYQQTLFIDKTLLTMSDEEFNNLTVGDFSRPKYKPITFEGLI